MVPSSRPLPSMGRETLVWPVTMVTSLFTGAFADNGGYLAGESFEAEYLTCIGLSGPAALSPGRGGLLRKLARRRQSA